ncbi:MAG: 4Fe-4S binding protein [Phycisphaerae bacterium]|nr:4Fe-4S binding protein [Phycisphaerae bacterium]
MKDELSESKPVRIDSGQSLQIAAKKARDQRGQIKTQVLVCAGTGCLANGSLGVTEALDRAIRDKGLDAKLSLGLKTTGCHGFCQQGPLVVIQPKGIFYKGVKAKDVEEIVEQTLVKGEVIQRLLYRDPNTRKRVEQYTEIPFYNRQHRIALRNIGKIDPGSIDDYIAVGGYAGLAKALTDMSPEQVIDAVSRSGLRGRGGGGFPTGRKWKTCRDAPCRDDGDTMCDTRETARAEARGSVEEARGSVEEARGSVDEARGSSTRYVLCNADEGDPGAFMDRSICEGDPHAVIEGMIIGAWAVGACRGYIYVREEYPLAVKHLGRAIEQARARGLLGEDILGTGFSYDIEIARGGGAFVCGESSALMKSVAGEVGEPRAKYVHSVIRGLHDRPTVLNNVETWANMSWIITEGAEKFAALGTKKSTGTKAFSLVGKVKNTGLVEVPMGITLREIIFDIGGGIIGNRPFKAVQTGGPSGGCLPESKLDLPVDFDSLTAAGSMMGSGGMIVMDDRTCMVDVARYFLRFLVDESCGKCVPCREGVHQLHQIVEGICAGNGKPSDIERIESLSDVIVKASLCALGKSAPNPVLSTLRYFREEYEAHINDKKCLAGVCRNLFTFRISEERCTGCGLCRKACPVDCIVGELRKVHRIDVERCTRCGACRNVCIPDAIEVC